MGFVREIYDGFQIDEVAATRSVNCKAEHRVEIVELVIR